MSVVRLVAEAVALGGGNLCASGHDWKAVGGRSCFCTSTTGDGMPVYRCARCGEYDYGLPGGPGYEHCQRCVPLHQGGLSDA